MAGGGSGDQPEEAVSETGSQVRGDLFAFSVPNFAAFFGRSFFICFFANGPAWTVSIHLFHFESARSQG